MQNRFEHFTLLINRIYRDIQKIKMAELKKMGLKGSHMTCIHYLGGANKALSFKELCMICDEDKSLVSKNLHSLIDLGLVDKDSVENKIYKGEFSLSKSGREIFKEIEIKTNQVCSQIYLDKDEKELETFYADLEEISNKLSAQINENY